MSRALAARLGMEPWSVAMTTSAPRPKVRSVSCLAVTISVTMLAFQAPPVAVTQPVTR